MAVGRCIEYRCLALTQQSIVRFLPRDAMHKRGYCRHAVPVRPSVTFVDHVKTNKHIFENFRRAVATPF